ncbi:hypothetical protein CHS0354_011142 [Potamilus streckersoni]|uniref:Uncharacterized protein n=1 Tax=Potamilus streckersoni TaxID=2493646 RepID=A0AAE0S0Y3_9BIVA|nr:hypothetical protein CHS0354_011142 [Potamilus streckersoni]
MEASFLHQVRDFLPYTKREIQRALSTSKQPKKSGRDTADEADERTNQGFLPRTAGETDNRVGIVRAEKRTGAGGQLSLPTCITSEGALGLSQLLVT